MKKIFNFALYDFANSAFTTIVITFIFATYFATKIAPNPVLGQSYWGWSIGLTGFLVAIIGPLVGSYADKINKIVFFIRFFSFIAKNKNGIEKIKNQILTNKAIALIF